MFPRSPTQCSVVAVSLTPPPSLALPRRRYASAGHTWTPKLLYVPTSRRHCKTPKFNDYVHHDLRLCAFCQKPSTWSLLTTLGHRFQQFIYRFTHVVDQRFFFLNIFFSIILFNVLSVTTWWANYICRPVAGEATTFTTVLHHVEIIINTSAFSRRNVSIFPKKPPFFNVYPLYHAVFLYLISLFSKFLYPGNRSHGAVGLS